MLNRDYRNVDRPTDVLSFALDEESEEEPELLGGPEEHLLGDIIISAETASRQAEEFGHGKLLKRLQVEERLDSLGVDRCAENAAQREDEYGHGADLLITWRYAW